MDASNGTRDLDCPLAWTNRSFIYHSVSSQFNYSRRGRFINEFSYDISVEKPRQLPVSDRNSTYLIPAVKSEIQHETSRLWRINIGKVHKLLHIRFYVPLIIFGASNMTSPSLKTLKTTLISWRYLNGGRRYIIVHFRDLIDPSDPGIDPLDLSEPCFDFFSFLLESAHH